MVATDGHRLALAETEHKIAGLNAEVRVLVPKKALLELQRLTAEAGDEGSIEFSRDDSYLFFQVGSAGWFRASLPDNSRTTQR